MFNELRLSSISHSTVFSVRHCRISLMLTWSSSRFVFRKYCMKITGRSKIKITLVNRANPNEHGATSCFNSWTLSSTFSKRCVTRYKPGGVVILGSHWNHQKERKREFRPLLLLNDLFIFATYMQIIARTIVGWLMKMKVFIHVRLGNLLMDVAEHIDCYRGKKSIASQVNEIRGFHLQEKYLLFPFSSRFLLFLSPAISWYDLTLRTKAFSGFCHQMQVVYPPIIVSWSQGWPSPLRPVDERLEHWSCVHSFSFSLDNDDDFSSSKLR